MTKVCDDCEREKPLSEFGIDRKQKDFHSKRCRWCVSKYARAWHEARKAKKNAR